MPCSKSYHPTSAGCVQILDVETGDFIGKSGKSVKSVKSREAVKVEKVGKPCFHQKKYVFTKTYIFSKKTHVFTKKKIDQMG